MFLIRNCRFPSLCSGVTSHSSCPLQRSCGHRRDEIIRLVLWLTSNNSLTRFLWTYVKFYQTENNYDKCFKHKYPGSQMIHRIAAWKNRVCENSRHLIISSVFHFVCKVVLLGEIPTKQISFLNFIVVSRRVSLQYARDTGGKRKVKKKSRLILLVWKNTRIGEIQTINFLRL
jgi:hypothetical protein